MFRPPITPKINILVKKKSDEQCLSKFMRAVLIFVLIILSLNFGILESESLKLNFIVKSFCVVKTLGVGFYLLFSVIISLGDPAMIIWNCSYIVESSVLVFTLLFSKGPTFVEFYKDMCLIDVKMSKGRSCRPEFIIIFGMLLCLSYRSLISITYCILFDDYCASPIYVLSTFPVLLCNDTFLIVYFVIYYSMYYRLKNFTASMKRSNSGILSNHFLYKSIVDVFDRVKVLYNPLFVVPLVFHIIDMMLTIFYPILQTDKKMSTPLSILAANQVFQVLVLLFAPAFASGLLVSQVEKLKLVLLDRMLQEREQKHTKDIERFIRYIEARPMKTVICKVIPLDWKLPVSVLNICVTYLIVILQFTHKY